MSPHCPVIYLRKLSVPRPMVLNDASTAAWFVCSCYELVPTRRPSPSDRTLDSAQEPILRSRVTTPALSKLTALLKNFFFQFCKNYLAYFYTGVVCNCKFRSRIGSRFVVQGMWPWWAFGLLRYVYIYLCNVFCITLSNSKEIFFCENPIVFSGLEPGSLVREGDSMTIAYIGRYCKYTTRCRPFCAI
jgi:hypothetical protein